MIQSFKAYNENAFNNLIFLIGSNLSILLIMLCAAAFVFLYLKEEVTMSVQEEQNIV
ncbi:MAG: hypothetical protein IK990_15120 [Ruminiclostridium sp.]|nr:hypothetical protein [Ruminiclostridium sp.]MBP3856934.1 hypothetical protein [Ruminiclostridium sp.]